MINLGFVLTKKQREWIDSRGGRNMNDVEVDSDNQLYIVMTDGFGNDVPVYIPVK